METEKGASPNIDMFLKKPPCAAPVPASRSVSLEGSGTSGPCTNEGAFLHTRRQEGTPKSVRPFFLKRAARGPRPSLGVLGI